MLPHLGETYGSGISTFRSSLHLGIRGVVNRINLKKHQDGNVIRQAIE